MRLASYNIEWFANLFDDNDRLVMDDRPSGRHGISRARQAEAVATVLAALDADAVMVIEAPNTGRRQDTVRALEGFAAAFALRARRAVIGFANDTDQEIALLYDPDRIAVRHDPQGPPEGQPEGGPAPRFDGAFRIDLDIDAKPEVVRFSKPPLELAAETAAGTRLRLIGAHLKSKAPHGETTRDGILRAAIANRRKQLAQAIWLRARIAAHLARDEALILMGDLNDGPGLDEFENLFGRSAVDILLGDELFDPHARADRTRRPGPPPSTARFAQPGTGRFLDALLDYIMISPDLMARRPAWRIWHPFQDAGAAAVAELRAALLDASDHFPVTLDIEI